MTQATILVLEDAPEILELMQDLLEFHGFTVLTATNGYEGLALMQEVDNLPDLIISDTTMPEMSGYQFLEILRQNEQWASIPFIFMPSNFTQDDDDYISHGRALGANAFLFKPFEMKQLLEAIRNQLRMT